MVVMNHFEIMNEKWMKALTFTHSVSLNGGQLMDDVIRTGPSGVFLQSYLIQFEIQVLPG